MKRIISSTVVCVVAMLGLRAQVNGEILVKSEFKPSAISLDGSAKWVITVEGATIQQVNFRPPVIDGLVLTYQQGAFHTQFINDKMTRSTVWTFRATPKKPGTFTLPAVDFTFDGKILTVPGATLTVDATATLASNSTSEKGQIKPLFLEIKYDRPEKWFAGQSVPAQLNLYVDAQLRGQLLSMLTKQGDEFSATQLTSEPEKTMVQIDNREYTKLGWKTLLTPLKSGEATLKFGLDLALEMPSRMSFDDDDDNDPFGAFNRALGRMLSERKQTKVETPLENISVVGLPLETQPQNFSGGIGHFTLTTPHIVEKEAVANESLTFVVEVKGEGNFDALKEPVLVIDEKIWRHYAPKASFEAEDTVGFTGKIKYEYILVPLAPGKQVLPEVNFTFFDPLKISYQTIKSKIPEPIEVKQPLPTKPSAVAVTTSVVPKSNDQAFIAGQLPDEDISLRTERWYKTNLPWISGKSWILWQILFLKLWCIFFLYEYYRFRKRTDKNFVRFHSLQKQMKQDEKEALRYEKEGNYESYYDSLYKMLQTAVALKSKKLDGAFSWSLEEIEEILSEQKCQLTPESMEILKEIIDANSQVKFGQGVNQTGIDRLSLNKLLREILKS